MALLSKFLTGQRQKKIAPYIKGDVLDLGCNDARILTEHGDKISSYCGIERSAELVRLLKEKYSTATFHTRNLDRDALVLSKKFDCVLMIALIEHLFNQQFIMAEVANVLKPGGVALITTPTPLGNDIVHRYGAEIGLFAKSAADDHIVLYNRHRFGILAGEVDLTLQHHRYFQCFCNQLAILQKPGTPQAEN